MKKVVAEIMFMVKNIKNGVLQVVGIWLQTQNSGLERYLLWSVDFGIIAATVRNKKVEIGLHTLIYLKK